VRALQQPLLFIESDGVDAQPGLSGHLPDLNPGFGHTIPTYTLGVDSRVKWRIRSCAIEKSSQFKLFIQFDELLETRLGAGPLHPSVRSASSPNPIDFLKLKVEMSEMGSRAVPR
jgi:hypothetical protein